MSSGSLDSLSANFLAMNTGASNGASLHRRDAFGALPDPPAAWTWVVAAAAAVGTLLGETAWLVLALECFLQFDRYQQSLAILLPLHFYRRVGIQQAPKSALAIINETRRGR